MKLVTYLACTRLFVTFGALSPNVFRRRFWCFVKRKDTFIVYVLYLLKTLWKEIQVPGCNCCKQGAISKRNSVSFTNYLRVLECSGMLRNFRCSMIPVPDFIELPNFVILQRCLHYYKLTQKGKRLHFSTIFHFNLA